MAKGSGGTRTSSTGKVSVRGLIDDYFFHNLNIVYSDGSSMRYNRIAEMRENKRFSDSNNLVVDVLVDSRSNAYPEEPEYGNYRFTFNRKTKKITRITSLD